ncbi:protein kinase domain-containing protein [Tautonia marina]|uniref:serine/threonine-protein kinase n=1 Tax=Tautonia marina TaxID=2653855 RepID=UPI0012613229|nr:serine/threonine-protein kinase [Tautonia marina]
MSQSCPTSAEIDQFLRAPDDLIQVDSRLHAIQLHILECLNCLEQMEGVAQKAVGTAFPDNASAFFGLAATSAEPVGLAPKIEGFVMGDRLGRGGMGTVFKAWQTAMHREVAIKVLPGGPLADPRWRAWCLAEARAAAQVRHPDAVQVYDVGMTDGYPYLVMEYVAGGSLANRLRNKPLMPFRDAARLLGRVARVVHHMHLRGLIHRDLKPGNILIDSPSDAPTSAWWPKVADFGLARPIGESARSLTLAGIGTPEYMAPELVQGSGAKSETFADIYALGAILYCLLVGRPPFQEASPQETLARVLEGSATLPRSIVRKLPRDLETIALKCLERDPHRRYATAEALADDLDSFLEGRTILARPMGPVRRSSRFVRRHPVGSALMMGLALTSATSLVLLGRAEAARSEAAANESLALERSREAERRRAEAESNRQQAEQMFQAAGRLLAIVSRADNPSIPRGEESLDELEAALPACRELLRSRPNDLDLLRTMSQMVYQLGYRRAHEGRPTQAARLFREGSETLDAALAHVPDDNLRHDTASLYQWHGQMLIKLQEFPEAIRVLKRSLELCDGPPGDRPLTLNQRRAAMERTIIGPHLIACGDESGRQVLIEAKVMLEGHLETAPDDHNTLAHLANVYQNLGDIDAELAIRRRLVREGINLRDRYSLATSMFYGIELAGDQDENRRHLRTAAEIVTLLGPCLPLFEREADESPGNPDVVGTLHHTLTLMILSLLDLGRLDEATDALDRLMTSIDVRRGRFPEPEPGYDPFYIGTFSSLGRILTHQTIPQPTFQDCLDRIQKILDERDLTIDQRSAVLSGLSQARAHAQTDAQRDRIAALFSLCITSIERLPPTENLTLVDIKQILDFAFVCRVAECVGDSERIVAWCGKALEAIPAEARDEPDYFAVISEYWTQVAKNHWQHEPVDEHALGDALRRSVEAAEEASRRAPSSGAYQAMVADRRARLERSGLAPGAIAQNPVRKD